MPLPLPTVPVTVYAIDVEVESADLNDYQTFMAAAKVYLEAGNFEGASTFDNTLGVTGVLSALSTVVATGLITASAGLTAAANQDVTVSGTGTFKHGSQILPINCNAAGIGTISSTGREVVDVAGTITFPVDLCVGRTVTKVEVFYKTSGSGVGLVDVDLRKNEADGTTPVAEISGSVDGSSGAWVNESITGSHVIAAGNSYYVELIVASGTLTVAHVEVTYQN